MILSTRDVLSSKKGIAEALGITLVGLALLVAAGVVVANYAIVSKQSSQLITLSQELSNRAELYASALNTDLLTTPVPSTVRTCSTTPAMCTQIISVSPSSDASKKVLRISGDMVSGIGQSLTKDFTLESQSVTHVTALDDNGNNIWALSDEGLRYSIWGLSSGDPTDVKSGDLAGPGVGNSWVSVEDRAGIDSAGALWVWGKNNIGQAGIGAASTADAAPKKIAGTTKFRSVVTGDDRGYAIDSTGSPWVWGKNDKGQLGLGNNTSVMVPTKISGLRMMTFAIGKDKVFGIKMTGDLVVVGTSQTGYPANSGYNWQTLTPGTQYRAVSASTDGAVATIDADGILNMEGNTYTFPVMTGTYTSVSLGATAGYAIGGSGTLYSWGSGPYGQLGLGSNTAPTGSAVVKSGTLFASVSGGKTSAFAVDVSGNLYYMGKTPGGSAAGSYLPQVNVPTKIVTESRFREVEAENSSLSVALLDTAGNLYGMGTSTPGLWPMGYSGSDAEPIRMPVPAGFPTYTWE